MSLSHGAEPKDLVGKYDVSGKTPEGEKFSGTAEIVHLKARTLQITWTIGNRVTIGKGKFVDNVLNIEYEGAVAEREGKAKYELKSEGRLIGQWHTKGRKGVGTEVMVPAKAE